MRDSRFLRGIDDYSAFSRVVRARKETNLLRPSKRSLDQIIAINTMRVASVNFTQVN
jgi:hypothetical protein